MRKLVVIFLALGIMSCGSDDAPETPQCVLDALTVFQNSDICDGDNLASWVFDGETVYCFADGNCPDAAGTARILDADCTLICTMGGANQLTTCQGLEWSTNASGENTIWRK